MNKAAEIWNVEKGTDRKLEGYTFEIIDANVSTTLPEEFKTDEKYNQQEVNFASDCITEDGEFKKGFLLSNDFHKMYQHE